MKQAALIVIAGLAATSTAYAQAWPNAAPSPYGNPTAGQATAVAPPATPAPSPTTTDGIELGAPPHALGAAAPSNTTPAQAAMGSPPAADLDNPQGGRATAALNVLEAQGYAAFSDFRPAGSAFTALVSDGGQQFRVVINPDTGQISRQ